jgi:hypothetical protein
MQSFAATVLILQLLAHGVAGCCWHHEHADHGYGQTTGVQVAAATEEKCCHHRQAAPDANLPEGSQQQAPDDDPCDESKCVLSISPTRVTVEVPSQLVFFGLASETCCPSIDIHSPPREVRGEVIEPPLRLHALIQVLLI